MRPDGIAIIPALNEAPRVGGVITSILENAPGFLPVVVDDGSRDDTAVVARSAGALVRPLPFNLGIGGAVQTGFRFAHRHGFRLAAQIDADGQHDPRLLTALAEPVRAGIVDIAVGSRRLPGSVYDGPRWRHFGLTVSAKAVGLTTGSTLTDGTSSFRAFGPAAIALYATQYPQGFFETLEATAIAVHNGLTVREFPIAGLRRESGESSLTFRRSAFFAIHALLALGLRMLPGRKPAGENIDVNGAGHE